MLHIRYTADCEGCRITPLDRATLEIICLVVRRTLCSRYRAAGEDFIRDAVQEAACKFYEQGNLRSEVNARTTYAWILTAATRELVHIVRYEGRFVLLEEDGEHPKSSGDEALRRGLAGGRETLTDRMTCHALLDDLPEELAEAMRLHSEGYTALEIARHVGCTEAAAYKRIQRGRLGLRQLWQDEEIRVRRLSA